MKDDIYILEDKAKQEEIRLVSLKIMERYGIENRVLVNKLAILLMENGIGINMFNSLNYQKKGGICLDEIVYYLLDRVVTGNKKKVSTVDSTKVINFEARKELVLMKRNMRGE